MNAYFIETHELPTPSSDPDPTYRIFEIVCAERRGRAKSLFTKAHTGLYGCEYLDIATCRKIASNVERDEGLARFDDPLWEIEFDEREFTRNGDG